MHTYVFILLHSARKITIITNVFLVVLYVTVYYELILYEYNWAVVLMLPLH
jgi:hypothetical protein